MCNILNNNLIIKIMNFICLNSDLDLKYWEILLTIKKQMRNTI